MAGADTSSDTWDGLRGALYEVSNEEYQNQGRTLGCP